ncbi:IS110 family transposase, partial [Neisseria meningitidis]|nr:IS110 family transposase [Neisseria meningitidis]
MRKLLETFATFLSLPTAETQTQVFGCFRTKYPLFHRTPHNRASAPPFRRQRAHL